MAFKLAKQDKFTASVKVSLPNDKGGFTPHTFRATFLMPSSDEVEELNKLINPELLKKQMVGWGDVTDDDGAGVHFNEENLAGMLQIPAAVGPLTLAFWNGVSGDTTRLKN